MGKVAGKTKEILSHPSFVQIGPSIRLIRKEAKMTLVQLSRAAGVSHSMLSHIERNLRDVRWSLLCRIASALDCTPEYIVRR